MFVTIRGRLVETALIVQVLSSGVVIQVVNKATLSGRLSEPPMSSPVQLVSVGVCMQLFKAETLVSKESTSVCMEEHVDVEHLRSNTDGKADEELYVVVQEESEGSERQAFAVVRSETVVASRSGRVSAAPKSVDVQALLVGVFMQAPREATLVSNPLKSDTTLAKVAGRLPAPPFVSEVQLDDVGVCIHVLRALWFVRRLSKSVDRAS